MPIVIASITRTNDPGYPVDSIDANYPTTVDANDYLLHFAARSSEFSGGAATPSGLTLIQQQTTGFGCYIAAYGKVATGSEGGTTVNFTTNGAADDRRWLAVILRLTGAAGVNAQAMGTEDFAPNRSSPSVTTTVNNCRIIYGIYSRDGSYEASPPTIPSGTTSIGAWSCNGSTSPSIALAYEDQSSAGATGSKTWGSSNDFSVAFTIAIEPTGDGPPIQSLFATITRNIPG
jgi:hypothetical protein